MLTRCCSPPEKVDGARCHNRSGTFRRVSRLAALAAHSSRETPDPAAVASPHPARKSSGLRAGTGSPSRWLNGELPVLCAPGPAPDRPIIAVADVDVSFIRQIVGVQRSQQRPDFAATQSDRAAPRIRRFHFQRGVLQHRQTHAVLLMPGQRFY